MALTPSFTITPTSNAAAFTLTDTSTGSDGAIVGKVILLYLVSNSLLVPSIPWPTATNPITISPLTQDVALNVTVNWVDVDGNVLYTASMIYAFVQYGEQFYYGLTQQATATPTIVNDQLYYQNKSILRDELDSAVQAITIGQDVYSAQECIGRYQQLINNATLNF